MTSLVTDIVDYFATMFSGDIGTAKVPLLFLIDHAILLGCVMRPVLEKRPNGEKRHWLTAVILHVLYIYGGSTVTSLLVGKKPGLLTTNLGWILYALGWFLAGFDQLRDFVLNTPAKLVVVAINALARTIFISSSLTAASNGCPGGLLVVFIPVMDTHSTDWYTYPIFTAIEGKPLTACKDWISFSPGVRNTFWAALLYFIFSGRAFGAFLPESMRFLANVAVCGPLMYDAIFNAYFGMNSSICGFIEAPIGAFIAYIQNVRDRMNEEYNKKRENKAVDEKSLEEQFDQKTAEEKKDQ